MAVCISLVSGPKIATQGRGLGDGGDLQKSSNAIATPYDPTTLLRSFFSSALPLFTRDFAREEIIEIPDSVHAVTQH